MSIPVAFLHPLAQSMGRLGIEPREFLRAAGAGDELSPDHRVSNARVETALAQLGRRVGDLAIGLSIARVSPFGTLGMFDHAVWASPTLGEALERSIRLHAAAGGGLSLRLDTSGGVARLGMGAPEWPTTTVLADLCLAIHVCRMRETFGDIGGMAVRLRHQATDVAPYASFFGEPPRFEASRDELVFDAAWLARRLRTIQPRPVGFPTRTSAGIARTRPFDDLPDRVAATIARRLSGDHAVTLPAVAAELGLSRRALQRHLESNETSHRELVDRARRAQALARLTETGEPAVAVARELGFATRQAFYRAFHRWTGMTVLEFRAARRGQRRSAAVADADLEETHRFPEPNRCGVSTLAAPP
jgi:AraC-like DNA-binding protein